MIRPLTACLSKRWRAFDPRGSTKGDRLRRALHVVWIELSASAFFGLSADAAESTLMPSPVTYTDGATALARPECGVGDLCATITLPDQDRVLVYNRGATKCGPFTLRLLTLHGDTVVLTSDVLTATRREPNTNCMRFANTYVTLDSGEIRMGVFLAKDGALFVRFLPGAR
jgi:hypothetical protein